MKKFSALYRPHGVTVPKSALLAVVVGLGDRLGFLIVLGLSQWLDRRRLIVSCFGGS